MLELDLLLNNFVEKKAARLDEKQRQTFELLLSYPDQTLFDLLLGEAISSDTMISNMVKDIRSTPF
jgi:antitoxin CptB